MFTLIYQQQGEVRGEEKCFWHYRLMGDFSCGSFHVGTTCCKTCHGDFARAQNHLVRGRREKTIDTDSSHHGNADRWEVMWLRLLYLRVGGASLEISGGMPWKGHVNSHCCKVPNDKTVVITKRKYYTGVPASISNKKNLMGIRWNILSEINGTLVMSDEYQLSSVVYSEHVRPLWNK